MVGLIIIMNTIFIPFPGRPRPTDFRNTGGASNEPLSRKKRQDSYLKAVGGLSPDEQDGSDNNSGKHYDKPNTYNLRKMRPSKIHFLIFQNSKIY